MIYFDVTKTGPAKYSSGLTRVSHRLLDELASQRCTAVVWKKGGWRNSETGREIAFSKARNEWLLTVELFSEGEREGFREFIESGKCKLAAVFHDAIPLKHPEITRRNSVLRAPDYMKMLSNFDRILAVSNYSANDLHEFWRFQGIAPRATVERITLGANFQKYTPRASAANTPAAANPAFLCVGALEPRKNQNFLLDVCEALWDEGLQFEMNFVGRVNEEFGEPIKSRIKTMRKKYRGLHLHESASDDAMLALYTKCRAALFPTIAEGCGLPPLEALWMGLPCVCSDLPVLREYTNSGGCVTAPVNHAAAWKAVLRRILTDETELTRLRSEVLARPLPTWADAAAQVRKSLV
ncbi:glycosyltransferase involved in cell wall biosynthesis [Ereboglobus sp. PH5-10]|uniref:glycosyltransferase n=1 Tax=Ereboglobus sp. PH5-10 TaxID=2940629 RepID=UPI00240616B2|nr:glycosyltransferase [Ereboglobus sp. PH5-10]MDF9827501.1 glycosyltransferase involved in cell wall biosynthesis [Ereboglobus sp. PH5-10]